MRSFPQTFSPDILEKVICHAKHVVEKKNDGNHLMQCRVNIVIESNRPAKIPFIYRLILAEYHLALLEAELFFAVRDYVVSLQFFHRSDLGMKQHTNVDMPLNKETRNKPNNVSPIEDCGAFSSKIFMLILGLLSVYVGTQYLILF